MGKTPGGRSSSAVTASMEITLFAAAALLVVGQWLLVARWLVGASGAVLNFLLNRAWAFSRRGEAWGKQAWRYTVTAALAVTLGTIVWWMLVRATPVDPRVLHPVSMVSVWLSFTYPTMRSWVFAAPAG